MSRQNYRERRAAITKLAEELRATRYGRCAPKDYLPHEFLLAVAKNTEYAELLDNGTSVAVYNPLRPTMKERIAAAKAVAAYFAPPR